jgi:hypothetical protein
MLRKANIAIALSLTLPAFAQQSVAQTTLPKVVANNQVVDPSQLSDITVSATRSARKVDDVPSSVSVITGATIQKEGARSLKEVFRNELDVTVPVGPTRFGVGGLETDSAPERPMYFSLNFFPFWNFSLWNFPLRILSYTPHPKNLLQSDWHTNDNGRYFSWYYTYIVLPFLCDVRPHVRYR